MGVKRAGLPFALALSLLAPGLALAQTNYEAQFGTPVQVNLDDLIRNPTQYYKRAVRTTGRLDFANNTTTGVAGYRYALRDGYGNSVRINPMSEVGTEFEDHAKTWLGGDVEVTGVLLQDSVRSQAGGQGELLNIQFWGFVGPEESDPSKPIKARDVTLATLVTTPGKYDGQTIRVVGKFRGRNLYGDLPGASQQKGADWVIKDDLFAIWVTDRKPKGRGWELDATLKRDTGKWIEVIGKPETRRGITYLRAMRVDLTTAPSATADAAPPTPPPPRPKKPPVIVFAIPLDGEANVPPNSRFVVQFNKDMDQATFAGRVFLRYAGPRRPGDRAFDGLKVTYDDGRRALTVDPGDLLREGRQVELLLLPGIADVDGLTLVARTPVSAPGGAIEVLRYEIGS